MRAGTPMSEKPADPTRQQVLRGGVYLLVRRGVAVLLGILGVLFINRIVGPGVQGLYSAAYGVFNFLLTVGLMGTHIYLIRERRDAPRALFHQAFWWLLLYGTGLMLMAAGAFWLLERGWVRTEPFALVATAVCLSLPLALVSYVPAALLERELDYRRVALIEVGAQLSYYLLAIPLALVGYGVWALVAGFWLGQLVQGGGYFAAARYRPRWHWHRALLAPMLRYSFSQAVSGWVYNLRELMPAFVLLPLAGREAVGYLAIANRFVSMLSFAQEAAGRLSVPTFARVQHDLQRLARAVSEAMQLQTLALGAPLSAFTLIAPLVLPTLLGVKWDTHVILIAFTLLGTRLLLSALFAIQGNALYVRQQNRLMLYANLAYIGVLVVLGSAMVWLLPAAYKLYGYLIADLIAHVPTYVIKHWGMVRHIGRPNYQIAAVWTVAMLCLLTAPVVSGWLYLVGAALLLTPVSRRRLRTLAHELRASAAAFNP